LRKFIAVAAAAAAAAHFDRKLSNIFSETFVQSLIAKIITDELPKHLYYNI
jgi:hypothetical protein